MPTHACPHTTPRGPLPGSITAMLVMSHVHDSFPMSAPWWPTVTVTVTATATEILSFMQDTWQGTLSSCAHYLPLFPGQPS